MTKEEKREYMHKWHAEHPDQMREWRAKHPGYDRDRYASNPEKYKEANRKSNEKHQEKVRGRIRKYNLKRKYGLTLVVFEEMLAAQGGACALCGESPHADHPLHVDHDHDTGVIRGLLCGHCNRMLGCAKDNPVTLRAAADYLERKDNE